MTRLLILDDSPDNQQSIREAADEAGYREKEIVVLGDLDVAKSRLAEPFDVAVIDIHLGKDLEDAGIGFIQKLHAGQPRCWIIALTKQLDNSAGVRALAYGAADFISDKWQSINWYVLLTEKLSIYKALVEGSGFPLPIPK